jgi:diketogulonate reductase-like aldo/keto reductase
LIHFPRAAKNGGGLKKIWKQMERAKQDGLVKSIGVSNYDTPELIQELLDVAEILP